jgi:hypothetical protein
MNPRKAFEEVLSSQKVAAEDPFQYLGEKIKNYIDQVRRQAREYLEEADDIERAWKKWDLRELERFDIINSRERRKLEDWIKAREGI